MDIITALSEKTRANLTIDFVEEVIDAPMNIVLGAILPRICPGHPVAIAR